MTTYSDIKNLLDASVNGSGADGAPHGAFWKTKTRDEFVAYTYRGVRLISSVFDPDSSGLIQALEGRSPFGKPNTPTDRFNRMPSGLPPMSAADITTIRNWISAGCPA